MKTEELIKLLDAEMVTPSADNWRVIRLAKYALEETLKADKTPLTGNDLMQMANTGTPIPPLRALATYADPKNWVQLYDCRDMPPQNGYHPAKCEWAFIGPVRPGYELAQNVIGREMPNS